MKKRPFNFKWIPPSSRWYNGKPTHRMESKHSTKIDYIYRDNSGIIIRKITYQRSFGCLGLRAWLSEQLCQLRLLKYNCGKGFSNGDQVILDKVSSPKQTRNLMVDIIHVMWRTLKILICFFAMGQQICLLIGWQKMLISVNYPNISINRISWVIFFKKQNIKSTLILYIWGLELN